MHIHELFNLKGKVAVVTGGSRGLGKEIALGLGEAGANVTITARREEWLIPTAEEIKNLGIDSLSLTADVCNLESVKSVVAETIRRWGKIDILVNNAGGTWGAPPEEMPMDKWESVIDTNAKGVLICCQQVGREMMRQGGGSIINVSSTTGIKGIDPKIIQAIGYQASKAAVNIMTKQLAVEWAPYNIRVNAIAPHFFPTRLVEAVIESGEERIIKNVPMGRTGREGEVKGAVVFLASEASSYITGQVIAIDGGATAW